MKSELLAALEAEPAKRRLIEAVRRRRAIGDSKEAILEVLEELRREVTEEEEDIILEVMDLLTGWGRPEHVIE